MKPSRHLVGEPSIDPQEYWATGLSCNDSHRDDPDPGNPRIKHDREPVVALRHRKDGWTAERQGIFLHTLANTGSAALSAETGQMTAPVGTAAQTSCLPLRTCATIEDEYRDTPIV